MAVGMCKTSKKTKTVQILPSGFAHFHQFRIIIEIIDILSGNVIIIQ